MAYEINEELARRAHEMTYTRPYEPGEATADYMRQVETARAVAAEVKPMCKTTAQRNRVDGMLDKYERTLAFAINRKNEVGTWCPSWLLVGGGNFPVRKKERQVEALRANQVNFDKATDILQKIRDYGHTAPINSRDPEALVALREELDKERENHAHMKAVNEYFKRCETLDGCADVGEYERAEIEGRMKQWGDPKPFVSWQLGNSRKRIHRLENRIKEMEAAVEANAQPVELDDLPGVTYHENSATMRVQLIFEGKPEPDVRAVLKSHAFHWCPSQGAWQRQLNANGKRAAHEVLEQIKVLQGG